MSSAGSLPSLSDGEQIAVIIAIAGTVQGVGFRPFVYRLAETNQIRGHVANTAAGVKILAAGKKRQVDEFIRQLQQDPPPLAVIDTLSVEADALPECPDFTIIESSDDTEKTVVLPPDISICADCRQELFDSSNRRHAYFLNNCTNCGPRFTIIRNLPYDRPETAMAPFPLCADCQREYENPKNRRFHAEATSCPQCGPRLRLTDARGQEIAVKNPLAWLAAKVNRGGIVAVQGLGGFHIICDATNDEAVANLRQRKQRPHKPFAVMVRDIAMAQACGRFDVASLALLNSPQRPIVIVPESYHCSPSVSGGLDRIGLFLPYTPLHLLLFQYFQSPIVATSANIAEEPIITDQRTVLSRLGSVIDYCLAFDRAIINGCDDSVAACVDEKTLLLRRARGYAPAALRLPQKLEHPVLALGGDMKNTIAIGRRDQAILSPHVGDLNSLGAQDYFKKNLKTFERLYDFKPEQLVCDAHPDYFTTRWALAQNLPVVRIQHHYAHALAAMVDCGIDMKTEILALCWDGTGYGDDGTLWGGEFLSCTYQGFQRTAYFQPLPLLGGEKAVLEPRRMALSQLFQIYGEETLQQRSPALASLSNEAVLNLFRMYEKRLNSPLSSSVGRLFDAAASLLGICQLLSYEGESGLRMEALYDAGEKGHYPFIYQNQIIDCSPAFSLMLTETNPSRGVTLFINMLAEIAIYVMRAQQHTEAIVCGGVFQNRCLLEKLLQRSREEGLRIYIPSRVPVNDGCISLGQLAAVLAH